MGLDPEPNDSESHRDGITDGLRVGSDSVSGRAGHPSHHQCRRTPPRRLAAARVSIAAGRPPGPHMKTKSSRITLCYSADSEPPRAERRRPGGAHPGRRPAATDSTATDRRRGGYTVTGRTGIDWDSDAAPGRARAAASAGPGAAGRRGGTLWSGLTYQAAGSARRGGRRADPGCPVRSRSRPGGAAAAPATEFRTGPSAPESAEPGRPGRRQPMAMAGRRISRAVTTRDSGVLSQ